jgi:hypothetical protein
MVPAPTSDAPPSQGQPAQRLAANSNRGSRFGSGRKQEVSESTSRRWLVPGLALLAVVIIGIGVYVWIGAGIPPMWSGQPQNPGPASSAAPAPQSALPGALPGALPAAAPVPAGAAPVTRTVKTSTITLDAVDLAVQDARERMASGDVAAARLILERYRDGGDPRAVFALAETYDPSVTKDPAFSDAKQAQALYEAAEKAGFAGSADRLARLNVSPAQ